MNLFSLAAHELRKAADIVDQIEKLKGELSATLGSSSLTAEARKIKRKMTDAGRLAIAAAQKVRWAKAKGSKLTAKKRTMSAAAKAKIAAAARARWKKAKAAGKKSL